MSSSPPSPAPPLTGPLSSDVLGIFFKPTVSAFIEALATGTVAEGMLVGTRGDGKTFGALGCLITHATLHHQLGLPLPTRWLGARDTFEAHKGNTLTALTDPVWRGAWRLSDGGHLAEFRQRGRTLVALELFGVKDRSEIDRLRTQAHGLWFEEPAPAAVLVSSSGMSLDAWTLGLTSLRLPSHANPAIMTLNYPDEDHWTWERFVTGNTDPEQRRCWRVPPGEWASAEQRERWARQLAQDPLMLRRLIEGEPGPVGLGRPVAETYRASLHVAPRRLTVERWQPLWLAFDGGLTPTCVIGQRLPDTVRIYAGLTIEHGGTRQLMEQVVLPWLERRAPWILDREAAEQRFIVYDPSMDTAEPGDAEHSPLQRIVRALPGHRRPGPVEWSERREALLGLLDPTRRILEIDPGEDTELLRKALGGRWDYAMTAAGAIRQIRPRKPNHPWEDLGDCVCYLAHALDRRGAGRPRRRQTQAISDFDVFSYNRNVKPGQRYATSDTAR